MGVVYQIKDLDNASSPRPTNDGVVSAISSIKKQVTTEAVTRAKNVVKKLRPFA